MRYQLKRNTKKNVEGSYGKYYPVPVQKNVISTKGVIKHVIDHNSTYSEGELTGALMDLVNAINELVRDGNAVKIDNLGIFKLAIDSKGCEDPKDFDVRTHVNSIRLRCQGAGSLMPKNLKDVKLVRAD